MQCILVICDTQGVNDANGILTICGLVTLGVMYTGHSLLLFDALKYSAENSHWQIVTL